MKQTDFSELTAKRKNWVEVNKDNGFDEGITNLLTELYPDNAHFIYELLQNAEDANATEVRFDLYEKALHFSHNGKIFDCKDLEGITSIGNGTKADDINKIGKFGVGFKAVFAYTSTPRIYSGGYNFEINDLVVPISIVPVSRDANSTLMIFPFNHKHRDSKKTKTTENAYFEIKKGLEVLQDNTLLFLTQIKKLQFTIDNISHYIERIEHNEQITITNSKNGTTTRWLRYKKYLADSQKLYVSIAYSLDDKQENIQPIDGRVSIFFPAEKERSNLKFHIHAPFASTVARDSIKDLGENKALRNMIAELANDSLLYIKDKGLLNYSFMNCLPIEEDGLSEFYKPIQETYINAFKKKALLKIQNGYYQPSLACIMGPKTTQRFMGEDLMMELIRHMPPYINRIQILLSELEKVYWLYPLNRTIHERARKFLISLEVIEVNGKTLSKLFYDFLCHSSDFGFLEKNTDEWFVELYAFLYQSYLRENFYCEEERKSRKLIKLIDGTLNKTGDKCYFSETQFSNYPIVHPKFKENEEACKFLEVLGTKKIEEKEKIEAELKEKYSENFPNIEMHLKDVQRWIEYFNNDGNIDFFQNYHCFLVQNTQDKTSWAQPQQIYIDEPLGKTGLRALVDLPGVYIISSAYSSLSDNELDSLYGFLTHLNAKVEIQIFEENRADYFCRTMNKYVCDNLRGLYTGKNISKKESFSDYYFQNGLIEKSKKDFHISLLIWNRLKGVSPAQLKAKYKPSDKVGYVVTDSALVVELKEHFYIPGKDGNFYPSRDISQDMLPEEFVFDNRNGWLTAIEFGEDIRKSQEEYKEKSKIVKEVAGEHDLEDIEALKDVPKDELKKFLESQKDSQNNKNMLSSTSPDLHGAIGKHEKNIDKKNEDINPAIVPNEEGYREKLQNQPDRNLKKSKNVQSKNISVKVKVGKDETKEFLKKQYKGYCQICGFTFDKKDHQGKYFEVFDWLSEKITGQKNTIIDAGSSLCLCSRCHSGIKYGDFEAKFLKKLKEIDLSEYTFNEFAFKTNTIADEDKIPECYDFVEMDMHKIPIRLLGEKQHIFYTEEHFLHFYNLLTLKDENE